MISKTLCVWCRYLLIVVFPFAVASCDRKEEKKAPVSFVKPEDNRFTAVPVTKPGALDEPMMFQVSNDGNVYIIERKGKLKKFEPLNNRMVELAKFDVFTGNEQGLIGLALDPEFDDNQWIYLQYAPANEKIFKLARYKIDGDRIEAGSEKVLLTIPVDRERTNHTGGGMAWDKDGNLYLTVGNNTGNSLNAQTDERKGHEHLDDQRGASNTNDLRGKILRIHPEGNGTYTIPDGNLFPKGTEKTRPEIYTMGHRNVWRVSVDSHTSWIFWGEIGPDQDKDTEYGPRGYDEQNMAKGPGFFGWPYFIADNQAIPKYDFANDRVGEKVNAEKPINTSPNNTGLRELPPAQPALIYYPYSASEKFPLVGSSSRCAIGGPVFHQDDFAKPERLYPAYYEGKWFIADYSRFWIMVVELEKDGTYKSMEQFAPHYRPVQPMDMKFAPSGDLYVLEYGSNTVRSPMESKLVRVTYNAGNRAPVANASAERKGGAVPFRTKLLTNGTIDYDRDKLDFAWKVEGNGKVLSLKGREPDLSLNEPGVYKAILTVRDAHGATASSAFNIIAGNEPPRIQLTWQGNQTFFFPGAEVRYEVKVFDEEDARSKKGINPKDVYVTMDYSSERFDVEALLASKRRSDASPRFYVAHLMNNSDCRTCHTLDKKAVGPAFRQIAEKYNGKPALIDTLAHRIIHGSSGIWGSDNNMPAHPDMSTAEAKTIAAYILSIVSGTEQSLPGKGKYTTSIPPGDEAKGKYILRVAYQDKGAGDIPSHTADTIVVFRSPKVDPLQANSIHNGALRDQLDEYVFLTTKSDSYIVFENIDLTGVKNISFRPNWHLYDIYSGGKVEIRLDGLDGQLVGETIIEPEQFNTRYRGLFDGIKSPTAEQVERSRRYPPLDPKTFFARGSDKTSFTIPSNARIKDTKGLHDIYFVFKAMTGKNSEALFPLAEIEFMNKTLP